MDIRGLPRESTRSARTRCTWPCEYTGRCVESTGYNVLTSDTIISLWQSQRTEDVRITWDMTVYTDKKLNHNRPDITLVGKDTQEWTLTDITVPADQIVISTEEGKVDRYQDLTFEIKRIHRASKVTVIPIVIGALGTVSKNAKTWRGKLDILDIVGSAQLSTILGTAHIFRKVQGPRSNFEIGGAPLVTQYWGGGHKTLFLTKSL